MRKEIMGLVALVVIVDAVFVAAYFVAEIRSSPDVGKLAFTAFWTLVTLGVVIRGLSRVRSARLREARTKTD